MSKHMTLATMQSTHLFGCNASNHYLVDSIVVDWYPQMIRITWQHTSLTLYCKMWMGYHMVSPKKSVGCDKIFCLGFIPCCMIWIMKSITCWQWFTYKSLNMNHNILDSLSGMSRRNKGMCLKWIHFQSTMSHVHFKVVLFVENNSKQYIKQNT